jgi:4'-phosphopantetheinyl transferase
MATMAATVDRGLPVPSRKVRLVEVWVAPLQVSASAHDALVATLTPAEHDRAGRYRFADDARRFSVARGWLRHVLGDAVGVPPSDIAFAAGPGKPRLATRGRPPGAAGAGGPCFNLSHAGELALIALSDGEVGVDVEPESSGPAALEAAAVACTPAEAAALDSLPVEARPTAALRMWTAKEAFLKATGEGLAVPPDRVQITAPWSVRELRPAAGYLGAVAAEGKDWEVVLRNPHLVSDRA